MFSKLAILIPTWSRVFVLSFQPVSPISVWNASVTWRVNFKKAKLTQLSYIYIVDAIKPVGTNYSRVIPTKEINPAERDEFWRKEEEEEKHRLQLEYERKLSETVKLEEVSSVWIFGQNWITKKPQKDTNFQSLAKSKLNFIAMKWHILLFLYNSYLVSETFLK